MRLARNTPYYFLCFALGAIPAAVGPQPQPLVQHQYHCLACSAFLLVSFDSFGRRHSLNVIRVAHGVPAVNAHEICQGENIPKRNTRGRDGMNCLNILMAIRIRRNGMGTWDGAHVSINGP